MIPKNPWKTLRSHTVYQNAWIRLREDAVIRPDGKEGIYSVVEITPSVGIVAINALDEIAFVGQWRYTLGKYSWEIPTGVSVEGEEVLLAAQRELREETGLASTSWREMGTVDNCNGVTTDVATLFLATELVEGKQELDAEEQIQRRWIPREEAIRMVMAGEITESVSVAGLLKAQRYLEMLSCA